MTGIRPIGDLELPGLVAGRQPLVRQKIIYPRGRLLDARQQIGNLDSAGIAKAMVFDERPYGDEIYSDCFQ